MYRILIVILFIGILALLGVKSASKSVSIINNTGKPAVHKDWVNGSFANAQIVNETLGLLMDNRMVCLKNTNNCLPMNDLLVSTKTISLGGNSDAFIQGLQWFTNITAQPFYSLSDSIFLKSNHDRLVVSLHPDSSNSLNLPNWAINSLERIPKHKTSILVLFGQSETITENHFKNFDAVIWVPENHPNVQHRMAQKIVGALPITGNLENSQFGLSPGFGLQVSSNGRLAIATPEELGMQTKSFEKIDQIARSGINAGAYPGCQIVVAVKGKVVYQKAFGRFTYDPQSSKVNNESLYDIASVTKIAASTLMAMTLHYQKKLVLDQKVGYYIPDVTGNTPYKKMVIREMMAHQAGLEPFINFYKKTMTNGEPKLPWYATLKDNNFSIPVADNLYLKSVYRDSIYSRIMRTPMKEKKYLYSDLCYYFLQPIMEKITNEKENNYVREHIYNLMGLKNINYTPLVFYPKERIVPTENDQYFRKQLLWGHVHDPGAAMLGGVGGHAGLFSNALDLAQIMQLFLNGGKYAGHQFFDEATVKEFTRAQFKGNKRGAGFDRPNASGGGTCDELASQKSFGHSGFTGTLAWADPKNEVVFVFLSNRVHPSQDNWKIRDMNIRTKIQHVVYEIVNARYGN